MGDKEKQERQEGSSLSNSEAIIPLDPWRLLSMLEIFVFELCMSYEITYCKSQDNHVVFHYCSVSIDEPNNDY